MKQPNISLKVAAYLSWLTAAIVILLPFHALLTVWLSSTFGHYTFWRLWKEFLLVGLIIGTGYLLLLDKGLRRKLAAWWPARLVLLYCLLLSASGFIALTTHNVTSRAMWYGLLVDLRFLIFFIVVAVISAKSGWLRHFWPKILLTPAILVSAFAVLQYLVLPYDFLKHFGYGPATIPPYETINHNIQHLRVASTLRGANPLGAYLILPISALAVFYRGKKQKLNKALLGAGLLLALAFSFSRSAWIGAALAILSIGWLSLRGLSKKLIFWILAFLVILGSLLTLALRNNPTFENIFLHTEHHSKVAASSNESHTAAFKSSLDDIYHQPLGGGVGTAGPQSTYNYIKNGRIAENYFLQIGQEVGIAGLALFIVICLLVGKMLYQNRSDPLALTLVASLIGITFVNLLSHAWTDDTLAYIWWGLAGVALAPRLKIR